MNSQAYKDKRRAVRRWAVVSAELHSFYNDDPRNNMSCKDSLLLKIIIINENEYYCGAIRYMIILKLADIEDLWSSFYLSQ